MKYLSVTAMAELEELEERELFIKFLDPESMQQAMRIRSSFSDRRTFNGKPIPERKPIVRHNGLCFRLIL